MIEKIFANVAPTIIKIIPIVKAKFLVKVIENFSFLVISNKKGFSTSIFQTNKSTKKYG